MNLRRSLPWVLFGLAMAGALGAGFLGNIVLRSGDVPVHPFVLLLLPSLLTGAYGLAGATIVHRHPGHLVGWLMLGWSLSFGIGVFAEEYAIHIPELPGRQWAAWESSWGWVGALYLLVVFLPLHIPSGRLPSPRWRPVRWWALGGMILLAATEAFDPSGFEHVDLENPLGLTSLAPVIDALSGAATAWFASAVLLAVGSLWVRFRSAPSLERQQLKWFMSGVIVTGLGILGLVVLYQVGRYELGLAVFGLAALSIPIALGVAVLRYRLYDIDLVINRTLVYLSLTVVLGLVYAGGVLLLSRLLPVEGNDLAVATSTLAVAALFSPLRLRVQELVDRRFYRSRYDARMTVEAFGSRLREEVDLDGLLARLVTVTGEALLPASASAWLREQPREGIR